MGVRILEGTYDGTQPRACLIDSTTGFAFGPLFDDWDGAHEFVEWFGSVEHYQAIRQLGILNDATDPRSLSDHALGELKVMWDSQRDRQQTTLDEAA